MDILSNCVCVEGGGGVGCVHFVITITLTCRYVKPWLKHFQINKALLIIDYKRFRYDPFSVLHDIENFLGLPHKIVNTDLQFSKKKNFFCKSTPNKREYPKCMRKNKGREHTAIPQYWRQKLKAYYHESNEKFFKLIGQDFGWNNE